MSQKSVELRTPKGTLDYSPDEVVTQNELIQQVVELFRKHGGMPIETPTFELRSVLTNKYGEDSKLIYDLEDQGGDICSLRYDLTVPFARYLSMNRISRVRRYQIGKVFRRDNPSFKSGRLREFIQADFDICGDGVPMLADAEVLTMISEILQGIGKEYVIRINDRRIIMGMLGRCGILPESYMAVCSTIDKADKLEWKELESEFISKGLNELQVNYIKKYMEVKGSNEEVIEFLEGENSYFKDSQPINDVFIDAINDLKVLLNYTSIFKANNLKIDLSLARGLDYYTGMIIEASIIGEDIGSVIGGGRYDNLCKSMSKHTVPCVGFSVGISRICTVIKAHEVERGIFVGSAHGLLIEERLKILEELWRAGIPAETFPGRRVNYKEQLENAIKQNFRIAVFTGENEISEGKLRIVKIWNRESINISREELIKYLRSN
ncbi:histidyl-tRNA synthetase [Pancytospora epiphaga]|nr:histidyl-tRNA synthetase [Pancytospora epiphaga]